MLAELCRDCAGNADRLVERFGRQGQSTVRVTSAGSARATTTARAMRGIVLRGLLYVLVALAAFVVVTTVALRG